MNEPLTNNPQIDIENETPDSLMDGFKGRGLASVILFTLIVHVVVIGGTSIPFIMNEILGEGTATLTEDERIQNAVQEATPMLRKIAEKYDLNPQELAGKFAGGGSRATKVADTMPAKTTDAGTTPDKQEPATAPTTEPKTDAGVEPDKPKSAIEKELDIKLDGPKQPSFKDEKPIF